MEGAYFQNLLLVIGLSSNYTSAWIILLYLHDKYPYTIYIGILYSFKAIWSSSVQILSIYTVLTLLAG